MKKTGQFPLVASRNRRWAHAATLAVLLLALPAALVAARQGATLRLQLLDGRQLNGELLAVKGEALLLLDRSGAGLQADIRQVVELRIVREGNVGKGIFRGLLAGFLIGGLIGVPMGLSGDHEFGPLFPIVILGGLGGGCGAIIGGGAGIIASNDEKVHCRERDDAWRGALLKRLQRLARFRGSAGPMAAAGPSSSGETAAALPAPQREEFRRWRLDASLA